MNVLFDISALGVGHSLPRARTGIFRAVEHLAIGLDAATEVDVDFCATTGNFRQCSDYLVSHPLLNNKKVLLPDAFLSRVLGIISSVKSQYDQDTVFYRVAKKYFSSLLNILKRAAPTIPESALDSADIYHSVSYGIPGQLLNRRPKIKAFYTIHDLIPIIHPEYFQFNEASIMKEFFRCVSHDDRFVCVSQSTKNDLCNYASWIDPEKVFVVPLAASEIFYPCKDATVIAETREKYGVPADSRYLLSVATLEPRKNIDMTIRCFTQLVMEFDLRDVSLVLVGPKGWIYNRIFNELQLTRSITDRVVVTGYVPDVDLAPLYSGALAFVYPSLYEGFGLPPLEAMQCGTPVITSNTSSLPEVVGEAGIMVNPSDGNALCQAMYELCRHESLQRDLSIKSHDRSQFFSWEKTTRKVVNLYYGV